MIKLLLISFVQLLVVHQALSQIHPPQILSDFPDAHNYEYNYDRVDYDNDGQKEVIIYDKFTDTLTIYRFENLTITPLSKKKVVYMEYYNVVDLNHDGYPEILYTTDNTLGYYRNNNGVLGINVTIQSGTTVDILNGDARDLDNDGDGDIIVMLEDYKLYLIINDNNAFNFSKRIPITNSFGSLGSINFCDYNQDGDMDIVFYHPYEGVHIVLNNGHNKFTSTRISDKLSHVTYGIEDFNGDGYPEIVQLRYSGSGVQPYGTVEVFQNPYGECCSAYYEDELWFPSDMIIRNLDDDMEPEILINDETSFTLFNVDGNNELVKETIYGGMQDTIFLQAQTKIDVDDFDNDGKFEVIQPIWTESVKYYETDFPVSQVEPYTCDNIPNPKKCPSGTVVIKTVQDIEALNLQYPHCSELNWDLIIEDGAIQDLHGLEHIRQIKGNLIIRNTLLDSIHELDLVFVKNRLEIKDNPNLEYVDIAELLYAREQLIILNNQKLKELNTFDSLVEAKNIVISGNAILEGVRGFYSIDDPEEIIFKDNVSLDSIFGFNNASPAKLVLDNSPVVFMEKIRLASEFSIMNSHYEDLSPFSLVRSSRLNLINIEGIESLEGLNLHENWNFHIENCPDLEGIGFPAKIRDLELINNPRFRDLTGLSPNATVRSDLRIINNPSLVSLDGLQNSNILHGSIVIEENASLSDIQALILLPEYPDSLTILNNPLLSYCHIPFICAYMQIENPYTISGNLDDCETDTTVLIACGIISGTTDSKNPGILLQPNPVVDELTINSGVKVEKVVVYNSFGETVLWEEIDTRQISCSGLMPGIYFLQLFTDEGVYVAKIIKN